MVEHIRDAQRLSPNNFVLTYRPNRAGNRRWYSNGGGQPGCSRLVRPTGYDCDEYPFFKTKEGGPTNFRLGRVSLRWIPPSQNRSIGAHFGVLARKMKNGDKFIVITSNTLPSVALPAGRSKK